MKNHWQSRTHSLQSSGSSLIDGSLSLMVDTASRFMLSAFVDGCSNTHEQAQTIYLHVQVTIVSLILCCFETHARKSCNSFPNLIYSKIPWKTMFRNFRSYKKNKTPISSLSSSSTRPYVPSLSGLSRITERHFLHLLPTPKASVNKRMNGDWSHLINVFVAPSTTWKFVFEAKIYIYIIPFEDLIKGFILLDLFTLLL